MIDMSMTIKKHSQKIKLSDSMNSVHFWLDVPSVTLRRCSRTSNWRLMACQNWRDCQKMLLRARFLRQNCEVPSRFQLYAMFRIRRPVCTVVALRCFVRPKNSTQKGRSHAVPKNEELNLYWHISEPNLSPEELDRLVEFLEALSDETFTPIIPEKVPSGLLTGVENARLAASAGDRP